MAMDKALAEELLRDLQAAADVTMRPMMGGYVLYLDGAVIGQLNEGNVYVKAVIDDPDVTRGLTTEPPYEGAKPALTIPRSRLADEAWLRILLTATAAKVSSHKRA